MTMPTVTTLLALLLLTPASSFTVTPSRSAFAPSFLPVRSSSTSTKKCNTLSMKADLVTYLRCEYISAALCTNQTPRAADVVLDLGTSDGRAASFLPRTVRTLITSSDTADGTLDVSIKRQLRQQLDRRFGGEEDMGGRIGIQIEEQRADDLKEVKDESVDVVISMMSAEVMQENGLDWKKSIDEAVRVLKPEGRLLFVERTDLGYVDYLIGLEEEQEIWESVGYDDVDLVLTPHIAGVAIKSKFAGMSPEEMAKMEKAKKKDQYAAMSISAFERGSKKKRRKKKKAEEEEEETSKK